MERHEHYKKSRAKNKKINKDLEKKVKQRTLELEHRNNELAQFAYIASHDLQEPLRTITSFTDLLTKNYEKKFDETGKKSLAFISEASERMRQLVKGLLDYSRIGRQKIKNPIDCNLLFNELKSELSYIISENNATIHIEQTLPTINGYKTEIRLLFANLLTNAIKFKKAGIPPEIKISVKNKKRYWVFSVSDNGIGIDEEYQKKIFIIFQRLHARNLYKGTGIGLAHCQKIANMHEGEIWVKSTPNIGSTFYVSLLKQPL